MNIRERLALIDPHKADFWQNSFYGHESLGNELGIFGLYGIDTSLFNHIKEFPLHKWLCTDTMVGYDALFLKEEFICITQQMGRKCDIHYHWASMEAIEKTRQYLLEALPKKEKSEFQFITERDWNFDPEKPLDTTNVL